MVYVLNKDKEPIMPTNRGGRVRWLLKNNLARVVNTKPFTIQLLYNTSNYTQRLTLGIDPGRTNIGLAVIDDGGNCVYAAQVSTRNKEIPKLMLARKQNRMKHRHLKRRCKRQRRAVAADSTLKNKVIERILPGYEKPIICHSIKNKEARFNNRKRPKGWLTPTANHLLQTHVNLVNKVKKLLPISNIVLEVNKFAFMELDNKNIKPWEYSKGPLSGFASVEDAVYSQQDGKCLFCKHEIEHYHHIIPTSKGGSNTLSNRVGLCEKHHRLVHTDEKWTAKLASKRAGLNKKHGALSVLNQIIPKLVESLGSLVTTGENTYNFRLKNSIPKDHYLDAYCIAYSSLSEIRNIDLDFQHYEIRQFRRHDRQACHKEMLNRNYYLDNEPVATNRHKAIEQKTPSLEEYALKFSENVSKLTVKEHKTTYKYMDRIFPGAKLKFNNQTFILQSGEGRYKGQVKYYNSVEGAKFRASKCELVTLNEGLVYL